MLPENTNDGMQDDYLDCSFYKGDFQNDDGIYSFSEGGKFYFSFMENGQVVLRSEGYSSEAGRDNGIASVLKNKDNDALYQVRQLSDKNWVLVLTALNKQEIARTCGSATEAEARSFLPSERAKAREALLIQAASKSTENVEDDYLVCGEHEEHLNERSKEYPEFSCFQHPVTGKFYFSWLTTNNEIILRSEGYPSELARDKGLASVINNREIKERYKVEEKRGLYYLVLTSGNYQEIGRSCPKKSEDELWRLIKPAEVDPIPSPAPIIAAAVPNPVNADKEDDYLLCSAYEGHHVAEQSKRVALFKHTNGLFYFAIYHADGSVRLRSEGFASLTKRDEELALAVNLIENQANFTTIEKAGFEIKILKDHYGREVGRTCPKKKIVAAAIPPIPAAAPIAAAPIAAAPIVEMAAPAAAGGFKWWWLLPLLLIPLFFLWKSCNKPEVAAEVAIPEVIADTVKVVSDTVKLVEEVAPAPVVGTDCNLEWILFDFDKYDITATAQSQLQKMVTILKENPTYTADLKAFTDAKGSDAYNVNLSRNRANAAKKVLVDAGIDAARIKADTYGEKAPIAKNTEDDSGRQFNRRVELFVLDADGKEVCKSIAPAIPDNLKE